MSKRNNGTLGDAPDHGRKGFKLVVLAQVAAVITVAATATIETGFDTSAQVEYQFTASRHLCGWKSDPGGTPQQLAVHT